MPNLITESKGICIYCGASAVNLTDEHMVPFSLGGKHIIKRASCNKCAAITSNFEGKVSRGLWGDARLAYGAPSRRKKLKPKFYLMKSVDTQLNDLEIAFSEYPAPMIFYWMPQAGLLQGLEETTDISSSWEVKVVWDQTKMKRLEERYPGRATGTFRHAPNEFGRMLLKIGYCDALTRLDIGDFEPICLPYILNPNLNVSFLVGGSLEPVPPVDIGYSTGLAGFGLVDDVFLICEIRLWANVHSPLYHAVVGRVFGQSNVEKVISKIGARLEFGAVSSQRNTTENNHIFPSSWQLS